MYNRPCLLTSHRYRHSFSVLLAKFCSMHKTSSSVRTVCHGHSSHQSVGEEKTCWQDQCLTWLQMKEEQASNHPHIFGCYNCRKNLSNDFLPYIARNSYVLWGILFPHANVTCEVWQCATCAFNPLECSNALSICGTVHILPRSVQCSSLII